LDKNREKGGVRTSPLFPCPDWQDARQGVIILLEKCGAKRAAFIFLYAV
jgi:hypothetical protein